MAQILLDELPNYNFFYQPAQRSGCLMRLAFAIGLIAIAVSPLARADTIYTVVETGIINTGTSEGTFGANGTNLAGQTFTATQYYDATLSTFNVNELYPASSWATIQVGNNTYNIASSTSRSNQYVLNGNEISTNTNYYGYYDGNIYMGYSNILSSLSLSQVFYYAVPTSLGFLQSATAQFSALDGTEFAGTISTVSLNGGVAPAPEPTSLALFGGGLALLGWVRRRTVGRWSPPSRKLAILSAMRQRE